MAKKSNRKPVGPTCSETTNRKSSESIQEAVGAFEAVTWIACGDPSDDPSGNGYVGPGWVKFGIEKREVGWRTLEFLSWVCDDMIRAGERLRFFPIAPPPYLNEPGKCLSFVIECWPDNGDQKTRFPKVAEFITWCREHHWAECRPHSRKNRPPTSDGR